MVIFVVAIVVAGYFVWRADHVKLIPYFKISQYLLEPYYTRDPQWEKKVFVQVVPECLTEAKIHGCMGYLLSIHRRASREDEWTATNLSEPWPLVWSRYQAAPLTLEPRIAQRLNLCWIGNHERRIYPCVALEPQPTIAVSLDVPMFRFDIHVSADDGAPVDVSVLLLIGEEWDHPQIEIIPRGAVRQ